MTHPYNIHPLALSPQHYLLARAGFILSPLRVVSDPGVVEAPAMVSESQLLVSAVVSEAVAHAIPIVSESMLLVDEVFQDWKGTWSGVYAADIQSVLIKNVAWANIIKINGVIVK